VQVPAVSLTSDAACCAGSSNKALVSQAVLLEHHNRQCDHDTEVLLIPIMPTISSREHV